MPSVISLGLLDLRLATKFPQSATNPRAVSEQAELGEGALEKVL